MYYILFKKISVMQSASLCLTCTPAEELAVALRTLLRPLAVLRVPVNEIGGCSGLFVAPHAPLCCLLFPSHHTMTSTRFDVFFVHSILLFVFFGIYFSGIVLVCVPVKTLPLKCLPR